ncbi:integral membrane protein [Geosmithia morbida]|uniref:Integral membrane protein n=1 Tax=Geosmithia morbida TaxID=1094350 RepID=A0A9P5D7Y6_9HYPO|nr:uncharacterized protein GMORB2_1476 [Geosmithia morbida]KAF4126230.1 integral membrane protein [Geosmithia morbida]
MRNYILSPGTPPLRYVVRQQGSRQRPLPAVPLRRHLSTKPEKPSSGPVSEDVPVSDAPTPLQLPLWQRLGPLTTAATAYGRAHRRRPWGTQFASALVIYCLADLSAQSISSDDPIDSKRTARNIFIGGLSAIPNYTWQVKFRRRLALAVCLRRCPFTFLSHHFNYSSHILSLVVKIVINQAIFAPVFNSYFFGMQALLSGRTLSETIDRIVRTVPASVVSSCQFWPFAHGFSFTFVPIQYRSIFNSTVNIGWQTYLALLNRRAEMEPKAETLSMAEVIERVKDVE